MATAVASAKERDLKPLTRECADALALDQEQLATMEVYLHDAWFFGIRTGHAVLADTKLGQIDPKPVTLGMQAEFQELMEDLGDALDTSVETTIAAWHFLGRAWIAGAKFWEVEITARVIEAQSGGIDEALGGLEE